MRIARLAAAALLLAGSTALHADQNLLVNPGFDTSLAGWQVAATPPASSASWDGTRDADGSPASGAGQGQFHSGAVTGLVPLFSQCVPVTLGKTYRLGGEIFIPQGNTSTASAYLVPLFFPTADCSGPPPPVTFVHTSPVTTVGQWTRTTGSFLNGYGGSVIISAYLEPSTPGTFTADFDDLSFAESTCTADAHTLCLNGGRFAVTATFDAGSGFAGTANAVPLTGDTGYLWFFDPANVEAIVKVIDGCAVGGHFWVFAGGLTDVRVHLAVTDEQTGTQKTYDNPAHTPFAPIQDTAAFACP